MSGAGRALQTVASVLLMSDPRDLGMVAQVRSPHAEHPVVYLYDGVPGGVGLAERLFDRHEELIAGALGAGRVVPVHRWLSGVRRAAPGGGRAWARSFARRLLALLAGVSRVESRKQKAA